MQATTAAMRATAASLAFIGAVATSCNPMQTSPTPDGGEPASESSPPPNDAAPSPRDASVRASGAFAWSQRAPLPIPRTRHGVAAVGGKVYAIGGYTGSMLARVDAYDPASDTWTQKADLHTARANFAIGVIGGKIYVAAGENLGEGGLHLDSMEVYDPEMDSWTELPPCPLPGPVNSGPGNRFTGGGTFHDQLHVMFTAAGGVNPANGMYAYDPQNNVWSELMPGPGTYNFGQEFATAAIGDALWVFMSPWGPGQLQGQLSTWYPSDKLWVIDTPLTSERGAFFTLDGKLYSASGVTGDSGTYAATTTVSSYDIAQSAWQPSGNVTVGREYAGAAVLDGKVYIVGGDIPVNGTAVPSAVLEVGVPQ